MNALDEAIDRVWDALGNRNSLFPSLPDDAAMARAHAGETKQATPRLLELAVFDELEHMTIVEPFEMLAEAGWRSWPDTERRAVEALLDTWWTWTRTAIEPTVGPGRVLACLCRTGISQVRWLGPWLDDLDGPPAQHLAEVIITQLPESEWEGWEDQRSQILGWSRTEPVIIGLTVVGGAHLDDGQLSQALDLML
jgi:hypothetical protein